MRRHSFDAVSLVFGVVFAGLGIMYLTGNEVDELFSRFWPAVLVVLGLAMLFTARREDREVLVPPSEPAAPEVSPATKPPSDTPA